MLNFPHCENGVEDAYFILKILLKKLTFTNFHGLFSNFLELDSDFLQNQSTFISLCFDLFERDRVWKVETFDDHVITREGPQF